MQYSGLLYYTNPGAAVPGSGTAKVTDMAGTVVPGAAVGSVTAGVSAGTVTVG